MDILDEFSEYEETLRQSLKEDKEHRENLEDFSNKLFDLFIRHRNFNQISYYEHKIINSIVLGCNVCDEIDKVIEERNSYLQSYIASTLIETGDEYQCPDCDFSTNHKGGFKSHTRSHNSN